MTTCIVTLGRQVTLKTESTTSSSKTSTLRDYNDYWITTLLSPTVKLHSLTTKDSTIMTSVRRLTSTTPKHEANDLGLNNREIIIYSICAGTVAVFLLMCSVCQRRYKQIYGNFKRYQTGNRQRINITQNPQQEIPLEDIDGIYEEIDESNMIDNVGNLRDGDISVVDTN
ncbi:unnamed protein product [Mytilus coruscus]|uniref:Uncharacterized protein n=1 Tax=Mytilus coruscus TaxID=42192 RepID=A0A6J8BCH1_MYTCO|nr:unnamed protein product [Mytilus coruscus]